MKVAIDLDTMRVLHAHRVHDIVHWLVMLESPNSAHVLFDDTERAAFLDGMTTLDLTLLHRNLTGTEFPPGWDDLQRREAIASVVNSIKPRLVDDAELEAQIEAVLREIQQPVGKAPQFRYVLGAKLPKREDGGLFPLKAAPLDPKGLAAAAQLAAQRRTLRAATPAPAPATPRPAPAQRRAPVASSGGSRPVIWAVADKVWEEAGKPKVVPVVLELRKRMMAILEDEHGVKRSTSSTALGVWMKERLAT